MCTAYNPPQGGSLCVVILDEFHCSEPNYESTVRVTLARHLSVRASVYFTDATINFCIPTQVVKLYFLL